MKIGIPTGRSLTVLEGAVIIAGTSIGAGILAIPVASYPLGLPLSSILLLGLGILNLLSALLLVEAMLRTKKVEHLPGLAKDYLGDWGALLMSASIAFSVYGALTAYMIAGGLSLCELSTGAIPRWVGSLAYAACAALVVWGGMWWLKNAEKALFSLMLLLAAAVILIALPFASAKGTGIAFSAIPLAFGVMFFAYYAHQVIPSVGNAMRGDGRKFAKAVAIGMSFPILAYLVWNVVLVSAIPVADLDLARLAGEPVTVPLGRMVGIVAMVAGGLFALLSTFTSFAGCAYSMVDAMQDAIHQWRHAKSSRTFIIVLVVLPSLLLALLSPHGFLRALDIVGFYGTGMLIGVFTPLIYLGALKNGKRKPGFAVPFGKAAAMLILAVFSAALAFKTVSLVFGWGA